METAGKMKQSGFAAIISEQVFCSYASNSCIFSFLIYKRRAEMFTWIFFIMVWSSK